MGGNNGGHVLRETGERGEEGYCVKEGGGEEGESERERAVKVRLYATALDIEVDPYWLDRRRPGSLYNTIETYLLLLLLQPPHTPSGPVCVYYCRPVIILQ